MTKIAIILGYVPKNLPFTANFQKLQYDTPYGNLSDSLLCGEYKNNEIVVLKRHGSNFSISSSQVNFKANIFALHMLGCQYIVATSVCGSLREEICPGEFVIFDQFINLSTHRGLSFIENIPKEKLNHSSFHKPFSDEIRDCLIEACVVNGLTTHTKGVVVAVDGPRQSTRAESNLYRQWGADVINSTTVPEAILSHELSIKYSSISLCTFYDSWRTDIPPSTLTEKEAIMLQHTEKFNGILDFCLDNLSVI